MAYLLLAVAIVAEVVATTLLKASDGFTRLLPAALSLLGYGIAFALLAQVVRTVPTGIAYAIWAGAGIVLIAWAAWAFHGQRPDAAAVIGMGLIVAGVLVLNLFSKMSVH